MPDQRHLLPAAALALIASACERLAENREMALSGQDKKGPSFEQVRRCTQLGPCPAGRKIGDCAAPAQAQVVVTLSGVMPSLVR